MRGYAVHPLRPFLRGIDAPYHTREIILRDHRDHFAWHTAVVPVRSRSGLARSGKGPARYVHRVEAMAAIFIRGRAQIAARWLCSTDNAIKAVPMADLGDYTPCPRCEDRASGPGVYRLRASDGTLLYVGAGAEVVLRIRSHRRTQSWWPDVARIQVDRFADMYAAFCAEVEAIKTEAPRHNQRCVGRTRYTQPSQPIATEEYGLQEYVARFEIGDAA